MDIFSLLEKYNFLSVILKLLLVFIITNISIRYSTKLIDKTISAKQKNEDFNSSRVETLGNVLKSFTTYGLYAIAIIACLTIIFGPIPLTFAGIGATIIGIGSQSLIKDICSGLFILFEGQYSIGDHITIGTNEGIVEALELRVTKIRAFNGNLYIIPNGSILQVTNHSNGPQRFEVFVSVDYSESTDNVSDILNTCCDIINSSNENIVSPASLIGISSFTNLGMTFRIVGKANPLTKVKIEAELRDIIQKEFTNNKIQFAKIQNIKK